MIYSENVLLCLVIPLLITFFFLQGLARKVMESFVFGMIWCLMSAYISGFAKVISGMSARLPWRPTRGSLTSPSYLARNLKINCIKKKKLCISGWGV